MIYISSTDSCLNFIHALKCGTRFLTGCMNVKTSKTKLGTFCPHHPHKTPIQPAFLLDSLSQLIMWTLSSHLTWESVAILNFFKFPCPSTSKIHGFSLLNISLLSCQLSSLSSLICSSFAPLEFILYFCQSGIFIPEVTV